MADKAMVKEKSKIDFKEKLKNFYEKYELYIMISPFIIWFLVFQYKPMMGLIMAFQDFNVYKGISGSEFIGLENFKAFLTSPYFYVTFKNTIMLSIYGLVFEFPFAIILALMLNEVKNKYFKSFVQTASFIPYFVAIVVAAGIAVNMLSPTTGVVNQILESFGFEKQYFLAKSEWFRTIFTGVNIWKDAGFNTIVYLAALAGVDQSLYEAAKIDGAGKWQQLKNITIPSIMPTIIIMLVLRVGQMLNVAFESVLLLYQPATYSTSDVISTYVYRTGLVAQDFGLSTAVGLFNAFVGLLLVYGANRISKKMTESSLW